jgi:hypothetical protein
MNAEAKCRWSNYPSFFARTGGLYMPHMTDMAIEIPLLLLLVLEAVVYKLLLGMHLKTNFRSIELQLYS